MRFHDLTLDPFQETAIARLQEGRSVLVSAPTGTGKTLVADWMVETTLAARGRVFYTAPVKALSNQKYRDWVARYGADTVGLVTGDLVINRDAPCLVMTTEILRNMLLSDGCPDHLHAVVIDEIHFLDDRERGTVWEELLIYLPPEVQIVGLSATLANIDDFAEWLESVRERPVDVIVEPRRAVPLEMLYASLETGLCRPQEYAHRWRQKGGGALRKKQGARRRRGPQRTRHHHLHRMMRRAGLLPYLYFVFSRRHTEQFARDLVRNLEGSLLSPTERERMEDHLWSVAGDLGATLSPELRQMYGSGVAFHHAGLHVQLKSLVERLYELRLIKVLYCTSTFALGINVPARAVVFDQVDKYDGTSTNPLTVRQFMQKAGRAGRRGMDTVGTVVIRMEMADYTTMKPQLERYAEGKPEPVRSSFNLSWNSVVNLIEQHEDDGIRTLVERSFLSWNLTKRRDVASQQLRDLGEGKLAPKDKRRQKRLQRERESSGARVWGEFQGKTRFLRDIGYLDGREFNAGARVLRHLQIAEIFTTELVLSGMLESLNEEDTFGVLCAATSTLSRNADLRVPPTRANRRLIHGMRQISEGAIVRGADQLTHVDSPFGPEMLVIGQMWCNGRSLDDILSDITSPTDLAGDMITAFRRAKDLANQLAVVYADHPERQALFRAIVRRVTRDEVEVIG